MDKFEFAKKIKEKYPQYLDVDDNILVDKIIEKYPQYKDSVKLGETGISGVATGFGKSFGRTILGLGELGQDVLQQTVGRGIEAITGTPKEQLGERVFERGTKEFEAVEAEFKPRTTAESIGAFGGEVAQFAVPGTKAEKLAKGSSLLAKTLLRGVTSGAVATAQEGEVGTKSLVAGATDAAFPLAGAAGKKLINVGEFALQKTGDVTKRLLKGLGADVDTIAENPQAVLNTLNRISGNKQETSKVLRENVKEISNGIKKIKKEASKSYREGLEKLQETDIDQSSFRSFVQDTLDKYGISIRETGERTFNNVEFDSSKNIKKANTLIEKLSRTDFDGKSLRKLVDDIDSEKYRTANSDERLSFNAFLTDLSSSVKEAINKSTDELSAINKAYSKDLQLVNAMEDIFGKQKFSGNVSELQKISERLSRSLDKLGLSEENINNFFERIGIEPTEFRASEAARRAVTEPTKPGTAGFGFGEIFRNISAGIINPEEATRLAVRFEQLPTLQKEKIVSLLSNASETARPIVLATIMEIFNDLQSN